MGAGDISDYHRARLLYNSGIGIILGSFGLSFYLSREITKNTSL